MRKFGLIGNNISYSLSPKIHNYLLEKYKIKGSYELIDIQEEELDKLNLNKYDGLNVTIPYKEKILTKVNIKEDIVLNLGVTNTLRNKNNNIEAYNTDILGFNKFYNKNIKEQIKYVAILGNGGTSKMLKYYFENKNIKAIIVSRTNSPQTISYEKISKFPIDFLINTTPLGQGKYRDKSPLSYKVLEKLNLKYFLDFNYSPFNSKLNLNCKSLAVKTFNGLEILVNQALFSFQIWNDLKIDEQTFEETYNLLKYTNINGIIVYGMPLSGKTTVYTKMSQKKLKNIQLYDLDLEITNKLKQEISEYVENNTIEQFRKIEEETLSQLLKQKKFNIIFVGGGTLTNKECLNNLSNYELMYKEEQLEILKQRLTIDEEQKRPLFKKVSLENLYNSRVKLYNNIYDTKLIENKFEKLIEVIEEINN